MLLGNLGNAYARLGEVRRAIGLYEQHLTVAREIGDRQGEAETSWNYGQLLIGQREIAQGLLLLDAAQAFFASIDHPQAIAMAATIAHVRQHGTLPQPSPNNDVLDGLPEAVRIALQQQDNAALQKALAALPPEEAAAIVTHLEERVSLVLVVGRTWRARCVSWSHFFRASLPSLAAINRRNPK